MANPEALVRGAAIVVGLLFGALGLFVTLMALGVFGGGWASGATPTWVGLAVGLAFTLGGLAVIVDYGIAGGSALDAAEVPGGVRTLQYLLGLGIAVSLAMFVTWVAFGTAARTPSTAAAAGSVLLWLFVAVMGVISLRRLLRRG
jgi:hypothetical protein